MKYRLRLYPYTGGSDDLIGLGEMATCRARAARRIRYHRNTLDYPVTILKRGLKWEMESDHDGMNMVGDNEGILSIQEVIEKVSGDDDDSLEDAWDEPRCLVCGEYESCCVCEDEEGEET